VGSPSDKIGLTATVATALADRGIASNVVAGSYHDHPFVPYQRRHDAMTRLIELA
jgi:hypothetical protein